MTEIITQHWHLAWMAAAALLIAYLGSPRFRNKRASERVRRLLKRSFDKQRYSQFYELQLPTGGGSDELDHLLISRFGMFAIVSEYRPGTISGGEAQEWWKQQRLGRSTRWPNPVRRAKLHVECLRLRLDLPANRVFPLVVIDGQEKIPDNMPPQVLSVDQLVPHLRQRTQQLFTMEQADRLARAVSQLALPAKKKFSVSLLIRCILALAIVVGIYRVYGEEIYGFVSNFSERVERAASPENFDESGQRKSEQQIYEDSLICAFSADTDRCACYEPAGEKADVEAALCQELAERGSVLKQ